MNKERFQGNWKQFKGKIRERWGRLTNDDLDVIAGREEQFVGKLQERYGIAKEEAVQQFREFLDACEEMETEHKTR